MNNPKISVIIPVYNVENYLSECLDSIINQTLREIEVICVNDGSTDNSLSILKDYASRDNRIKIIDKENQGQGYARKCGLNIAMGKYILFLDSDDKYISNNVFKKMYDYIDNNDFDICIFDLSYWKKEKISPQHYDYDKEKIILKNRMWMCWNKIYRKSFFDKYNDWYFPVKHHLTQDVELHVQVLVRANSVGYINEPIVLYRVDNTNSATKSKVDLNRMLAPCIYIRKTFEVIQNLLIRDSIIESTIEQLKKEFIYFTLSQLLMYIERGDRNNISPIKYIDEYQKILFELKDKFDPYIKEYPLCKQANFPYLNKKEILFYKLMLRLKGKNLFIYFERKLFREQYRKIQKNNKNILSKNETIAKRDNTIQNKDFIINQKNNEIQNLHTQNNNLIVQNNIQEQVIKRLQNSWSYKIGRFFIYPLSIPLDFYRFIRDYNLIKKSNLFDSEYYLSQNEDVKNAKMNPIKHYLKFGWKEGRNPSAKFNGNEYLNQRPDVRVACICPLVHYLKFGKDEK